MDAPIGHLVPDLEYRHHARLATRLVRRDWESGKRPRILSLEGAGPLSADLPAGAAIPVRRRRGRIPPSGWPELKEWLQRDPPASLHIWGKSALWAWRAIRPLVPRRPPWIFSPLIGETLTRWDFRLLSDCGEIAVPHIDFPGLESRSHRVLECPPAAEDAAETIASPLLHQDTRVILSVGRMDRFETFRDALWAFDILARADRSLHLVLIGDGPARGRLEEFARALKSNAGTILFLGSGANPTAWLRRAALCWIPNDARGGLCRLRESLTAGRPTVGPDLDHLKTAHQNTPLYRQYRAGSGVDLARVTLVSLIS